MSDTTLQLSHKLALPGGGVELADVRSFDGQESVAKLRLWIGERYREVVLRAGEIAHAGGVAVQVMRVGSREAGTTVVIRDLDTSTITAEFGQPLVVELGQKLRFQTGQTLLLTAVGRFGIEILFRASDQCENFTRFDFGFWRDDGLVFEVDEFDPENGTARIRVDRQETVDRVLAARFDDVVSLRPRDVVRFPDGVELRLRRAIQQPYDAIDWRLLAENGDDISYLYAGATTTSGTPDATECRFGLLGRTYDLQLAGMSLAPEVALRFTVKAEPARHFALGVSFVLEHGAPLEGPGGLRLIYRGSGHAHGESLGPDGEMTPMTTAWAEFGASFGGESRGFQVDITDDDLPVTEHVFGYRVAVLSVGDVAAVLRVDGGPGASRDVSFEEVTFDDPDFDDPDFDDPAFDDEPLGVDDIDPT